MYRRSAAVLWLALGFGAGVWAEIGSGAAAWLPATALAAVGLQGGFAVVSGVSTSIAAGWVAARAEPSGPPPRDVNLPAAAASGLPAQLRAALDRRIENAIGPLAAPLALALVSGRRGTVPRSVRSEFARSGTAHLLAISGFHVGVIAGLFGLAAAVCGAGPRARTAIASVLVWGYVLMIGSPASGVRAAGLLTVLSCGRLLGRPTRRLPGLASVFLLSLFIRPSLLSGIGFQLSFAASLGLLATSGWPDRSWACLTTSPLGVRLSGHRGTQRAVEAVVRSAMVAVGATLPTVPLIAWHFGSVSLVSIPATLVAMPLAAASIVAVLFAVLVNAIVPAFGSLVGGGAASVLALFELTVRGWASLHFAAIPMSGYAGLVFAITGGVVVTLVRGSVTRATLPFAIAVGIVSSLWLMDGWGSSTSRGRLELFFIDVGQGDAILVRSPANRWTLVDAGPANGEWDAGARRVAPLLARLGVRRLETLVLTHPDADHVGGAAAVLRAVEVGAVADPGNARGSRAFIEALEEAAQRGVTWRAVQAGQAWELDGVHFEVLWPRRDKTVRSANDDSVILLVRFGDFEVLLTGDASVEIEEALLLQLPEELEVLKVGHHGSKTSTASAMLAKVHAQLAVISVGRRNRYGHPAPNVVSRLERHGAQILRTDREGTVRVTARADGSFRVTGQRP